MKSKTILLIEDETTLLEIASDRFRHAGYDVHTAANGEDGLRSAAKVHPDLILLDVLMPGLSGFEVLKKLKEDPTLRTIPVAIFSNLAQEQDILQSKELGAIDFLIKANFTPAQLVERADQLIAQSSAT